DSKHETARSWWAEVRSKLPVTRTHRTRSGGLHLLYRHVPGIGCSASKLARGVDTRGGGGFVIWWPAQGCKVLGDAPVAAAPDWLIKALRSSPPQPRSKVGPISIHGDRRALRGLLRLIAAANEGQRNQITYWAACRAGEMVTDGKLSESDAIALLVEAA